jgi:orotate phosphoribosyltransferase
MMDWRQEIQKFIVRRDGADGTRSYVDVKGMMGRPELLYDVVGEIGDLILRKHPKVKAIGSHGVGGSFLIGPTILYVYSHWYNVNGFFVRLDARENGEHLPVEGRIERGWRVLIVDDVLETGGACMKACNILRSHGCEVDGIVVVVDLSRGENECLQAGLKVESLLTL